MQCGICQKDMFGASESPDGLTICGSCVMAPLPPPPEDDIDKAQISDVGYDLSYLIDQEGQRDRARNTLKKSKSVHQVRMDTGQMALGQPTPLQKAQPVKKLKLKSNSVRERMHPVGSLMLRFDEHGVAEFAECCLATVKEHMRLRPGRYRLLDEEKAVPKKDPRVAMEAARAVLEAARAEPEPEPEPEVQSEPEPEPEPLEPAAIVVMPPEDGAMKKPKAKARKTTKKSSSRKKSKES